MGKYGESVGKWELKVGGFDKELTPKKGDARKLLNMMLKARENSNMEVLFNNFEQFIRELIARDHPPLNDEEKKELDLYVEYNLMELLIETQIQFKFITRDDIEKQKKDLLQTPSVQGIVQPPKQQLAKRSQGLNMTG